MKRDMDLLRLLLLELEGLDQDGQSIYHFKSDDITIEGFTWEQVNYHYDLAVEAGLVDQGGSGVMQGLLFRRLTWSGHDFLDAVRDNEIWKKTRQGATAAGGFSVDLLKDLAKGFIRKKISDHTGVEI
ncbi:DUF2513 domain-containing protein [Pseudomonas extremaustralis]|uniref:DUF2513 domain-containing protein n=1 Tax=Pseudomonas extremaustralis TaxID=359110 RepID=UPI0021C83958|nr:DUF2513 domain-containing protein [Pseudomonas extremaustralis]UUJ43216.1 DUF2513 domain-containing protein [Pseudomonas extremaustralis]